MDRGVLHGMGAFETMRAEEGRLMRWEAHVSRFSQAVRLLGLVERPWGDLREVVRELCVRNGCEHGVARVRLTATAGAGKLDEQGVGEFAHCWLTACSWAEKTATAELGVLPWRRNEGSALEGIKATSYAENLIAMRYACANGWNEGVFLNNTGEVCEAIMANLFLQLGREIVTPPLASGCLPGVMRGDVLARGLAREARCSLEDLYRADALWISSALRGVVPVSSLDGVRKEVRNFAIVDEV